MAMTHLPRRGVTLLELIIVIGLLLILAALLLPAVAKVRQAAGRTQSANHLKQLGISVHAYHDANRKLPPIVGMVGAMEGSVFFFLLPYVEQDNLFKSAFKDGQRANSWTIAGAVVPIFMDPEDRSAANAKFQDAIATTSYAGNWQILNGKYTVANIPDGSSNTMLFTTRHQICNGTPTAWAYTAISPWAPMVGYYGTAKFQLTPQATDCDPLVAQSNGSVILVGLADGSVRSVSANISPRTWSFVMDPADGNPLDADF